MFRTIVATELQKSTDITEATPSFSQKCDLNVTPASNKLQDAHKTNQETNANALNFTFSQGTIVANFEMPTPRQASHVPVKSFQQITLLFSYPYEATNFINQLF